MDENLSASAITMAAVDVIATPGHPSGPVTSRSPRSHLGGASFKTTKSITIFRASLDVRTPAAVRRRPGFMRIRAARRAYAR